MDEITDAQRLDHLAENPEDLRFLYDAIGEVYVNNRTGELRTGRGATIREAIDYCIRADAKVTK